MWGLGRWLKVILLFSSSVNVSALLSHSLSLPLFPRNTNFPSISLFVPPLFSFSIYQDLASLIIFSSLLTGIISSIRSIFAWSMDLVLRNGTMMFSEDAAFPKLFTWLYLDENCSGFRVNLCLNSLEWKTNPGLYVCRNLSGGRFWVSLFFHASTCLGLK